MYRNKTLIIITILFLPMLLNSCGEGTVDVTEAKYEPKIVIEGYLYPFRSVENIKISRNFPLNEKPAESEIVLYHADVSITDLSTGKAYKLTFNHESFSFEYNGPDLVIKYGNSYKLSVSAVIDGKLLQASSTTTVPLSGFRIEKGYLGQMSYRERDESGNLKNFFIRYTPSPSSDFYVISFVPEYAGFSTFIYDNAYFKPDSSSIQEFLDNSAHQYRWMQNVNPKAPSAEYKVEWFDIWFYGNYTVAVYAADKNFADFVLTNRMVQEFDGNFHEPKLHIEGDGIGVFGSAVPETVGFTIKK